MSRTTTLPKSLKGYLSCKEKEAVWSKAEEIYQELLPGANNEPKDRQRNMVNYIFPYIALYRAMLDQGYVEEEAYHILYTMSENYARNTMRKMYVKAGRLPFFFGLFRRMFSKGLQGNSWEVEFVTNSKEQFEYNIKKCLWHDVCVKYQCPELCNIFCHSDEINFNGVSKQLYFRRSQTLGSGGTCCDFHFYKNNPDQ